MLTASGGVGATASGGVGATASGGVGAELMGAMYPNLKTLASICLTMPVTTASVERSFSHMKKYQVPATEQAV